MTKKLLLGVLASALLVTQAQADEEEAIPEWGTDTLTGDWGGLRTDLYKKGLAIGATHKSDWLANVSGGIENGSAWMGHTEFRLDMDLEKLFGWSSTTAFVLYHGDLGSKFNSHYVGGIVGVDNIEVAKNTAQFYDAWIQKNLFQDRLSVLFGLYHVDSEFYVTDTSALFLQPPYGMANELALTGQAGPPIFPLGALSVRLKAYSPGMDFYVQAAVSDGVPGDPGNPRHTQISLADGDGTFSIVELGYQPQTIPEHADDASEPEERFNKTAIGFWRYSSRFDAIDGTGRHNSHGGYFLAERTLWTESAKSGEGLSGFVRAGFTNDEVNPLDWSASLGLRYRGPFAGRSDDIAGVAVTVNHGGNPFRAAGNLENQETDIELTYRAQVKPWLAIQPNMQIVLDPGLDPAIDNAWILGTRIEVEL